MLPATGEVSGPSAVTGQRLIVATVGPGGRHPERTHRQHEISEGWSRPDQNISNLTEALSMQISRRIIINYTPIVIGFRPETLPLDSCKLKSDFKLRNSGFELPDLGDRISAIGRSRFKVLSRGT